MDKDAYTIPEFCARHSISRATFYNLKKVGKAPRTMELGSAQRITKEAAADWRRELETQAVKAELAPEAA